MSQATQQANNAPAADKNVVATTQGSSATEQRGFLGRTYDNTTGFLGKLVPDFFINSGYTLLPEQTAKAAQALFIPSTTSVVTQDDDHVIEDTAGVRLLLSSMMLSDGSNQAYLEKRMADAEDLVYLTVAKIKESIYSGAEVPVDPDMEKLSRVAMEFRAYVDMRGSQAGFMGHDLETFSRMMTRIDTEAFRESLVLAQPASAFPVIYDRQLSQMTMALSRESLASYEPGPRQFLSKVLDLVEAPSANVVVNNPSAAEGSAAVAATQVQPAPAGVVRKQSQAPKSQKGNDLFNFLQRQLLSRYLSEHKNGAKLDVASDEVLKHSLRIMEEMSMTEADLKLILAPEVVAQIQEKFAAVRFED